MFWIAAILVLAATTASAQVDPNTAIARGYVFLNIINEQPQITEIRLTPQPAYKDSVLECLAKVKDEQLDSIKLHYTWFVNGIKRKNDHYKLSGFSEDDVVRCSVMAEDISHQLSSAKTMSTQIETAPVMTKAMSQLLSGLGVETDIAHTLRLQEQGPGAITGYTITETAAAGTQELIVVLFGLMFLTVLNANLLLRYHLKRKTA